MANLIITNNNILTPLILVMQIFPIKSGFWRKLSVNMDISFRYSRVNLLSKLSAIKEDINTLAKNDELD